MWGRARTKRYTVAVTAVVFLVFQNSGSVLATSKGPDAGCVDLLLVFTRGSGQNPNAELTDLALDPKFEKLEPESYSFFNWFKTHLDKEYPHIDYKPITVHDFPGKYDPVGYKAVSIFPEVLNAANGEFSVLPGEYRSSVEHGTVETVGYLKDQINSCPDQSIIVGGYSQGAQVMGDAIAQLNQQERSKILGIGLFGDPKFIAAKGDSLLNPFDKSVSYPWRRGDATNKDKGMLDPRIPYVPQDIENRTTSYCMRTDPICSGWSGYNKNFRTVHSGYGDSPMFNTVNELMQWAAPKLSYIERSKGGLSVSDETPAPDTPIPDGKTRDIMFLLNDDSLSKALGSFRYDTDLVINPLVALFPNTNFAAKGFGEGEQSGTSLPRVNNVQSFLPYTGYDPNNPMFSTSNLYRSLAGRYPFAQPYTTGGDFDDPHGLAIERSVLSGGWRPEAEKHLVLITDRAPKLNYSYNICNATVRSWLQIPNTDGYSACYSNMGFDAWPSQQHPEVCETLYLALTQQDCKNPIKVPGYTQMVNRSLDDGITAAQSQHIVVDVVVPYKVTDQYNPASITKMQADLQYLAKATGGQFIYYNQKDQFDRASYSDMMIQIFGHKPKDILLAYKEAMDGRDAFNQGHVLGASTNQPVILDATQSNTKFAEYNWDFNNDGQWDEISPGPVVEHRFTAPQTGFVRVAGITDNGDIQAETRLAVAVTESQPIPEPVIPTVPEVTATIQTDGTIKLMWQSAEAGDLLVTDPESHLPLALKPLTDRTATFIPDKTYATLDVQVITDDVITDRQAINVETPLLPVVDDLIPDDQPPIVVEDPQPNDTPPAVVVDQTEPDVIVEEQTDNNPSPVVGEPDPVEQTDTKSPLVVDDPLSPEQTDSAPPVVTDNSGPVGQTQDETPAVQQEPDPTLCYKLQQCASDSDPTAQLVTQPGQDVITQTPSTTTQIVTTQQPQRNNQTPQVEGVAITAGSVEPQKTLATTAPPQQTVKRTNHKQVFFGLFVAILFAGWFYYRAKLKRQPA